MHWMMGLLAENGLPPPDFELADHLRGAKLAVSNQQDRRVGRVQPIHITQQGQLFGRRAVPSAPPHPGPGEGDRPAAKGNGNDQELVSEADLGAIGDEAHPPPVRAMACTNEQATGSYHFRTRTAGLSRKRLSRRTMLSERAAPGMWTAIWLR